MKKINYLILTLGLSLAAFPLSAQTLERFVVGSAGFSGQNENLQLSFTVGEAVVSSFNTDSLQLTQGFQQTHVEEIPTGIELPTYIQNIIAYPNPVGTTLYLDIHTSKVFEFSMEVYNTAGQQQVFTTDFLSVTGNMQHQIDLIGLTPGIYLLMIKTKEGYPVKIFKIQKM